VAPQPKILVLHTSWRGRLLSFGSPLLLLAIGAVVVSGRAAVVGWFVIAVAVLLVLVGFLDYPLTVRLGPDGIERRCVARRSTLLWADVEAVVRPSVLQPGMLRWFGGNNGLAAEQGKRRYLLTDSLESEAENDALHTRLAIWDPGITILAPKPPPSSTPTWLYKRVAKEQRDPSGLIHEM